MTRLACAAALGLLLAVTLLSAWPKPADAQDDTLRKAIEAAVRSAIEDTVRKAVDDAVKKALGDLKAAGAVSAAAPPVATPPVATPPVVVTAPVVAAPATAAKNADTNTRDAATKAATDRIGELIAASTPAAKIREATIDLAVPKSPAFAALGLTPDSVVRPGSLDRKSVV